ncbi:MAG: hypothetical protein HKL82_09205 [Acidimicrobiaceae bacterium]|nr:hypothetical protein [Acidimicrobiaceae bacterium]
MYEPKPIRFSLSKIERWLEIMPSSDYRSAEDVIAAVVGDNFNKLWSIDKMSEKEVLIRVDTTTTLIAFRMRRLQIQRALSDAGLTVEVKLRLDR